MSEPKLKSWIGETRADGKATWDSLPTNHEVIRPDKKMTNHLKDAQATQTDVEDGDA